MPPVDPDKTGFIGRPYGGARTVVPPLPFLRFHTFLHPRTRHTRHTGHTGHTRSRTVVDKVCAPLGGKAEERVVLPHHAPKHRVLVLLRLGGHLKRGPLKSTGGAAGPFPPRFVWVPACFPSEAKTRRRVASVSPGGSRSLTTSAHPSNQRIRCISPCFTDTHAPPKFSPPAQEQRKKIK